MYDKRELIKAALRFAMEHSSPEALKKYLKDHPNADKSKHTVKSDSAKSDSAKSDSAKSDSDLSVEGTKKKMEKAKEAVKSAETALKDANDKVDELFDDESEQSELSDVVHGESKGLENKTYFTSFGSGSGSSENELIHALSNARSSNVRDLLVYAPKDENNDLLMDIIAGGKCTVPASALESKEAFDKWSDGMQASFGKMVDSFNGYAKVYEGDKQGLGHLPDKIQSLSGRLQRDLEYALSDLGKEYKGNKIFDKVQALQASRVAEVSLRKKKDELTGYENLHEKAKKEEAEKPKKEKSKSIDEMSPAELKAQAEEAIKNSKMSPEEKQKAIKRMKKKKPEDMKAMLLSMGDEEEEGAGKQAFLRQANDLMVKIAYNQRCLVDLQRKIEELRRSR